jgi:hypothetical protein
VRNTKSPPAVRSGGSERTLHAATRCAERTLGRRWSTTSPTRPRFRGLLLQVHRGLLTDTEFTQSSSANAKVKHSRCDAPRLPRWPSCECRTLPSIRFAKLVAHLLLLGLRRVIVCVWPTQRQPRQLCERQRHGHGSGEQVPRHTKLQDDSAASQPHHRQACSVTVECLAGTITFGVTRRHVGPCLPRAWSGTRCWRHVTSLHQEQHSNEIGQRSSPFRHRNRRSPRCYSRTLLRYPPRGSRRRCSAL